MTVPYAQLSFACTACQNIVWFLAVVSMTIAIPLACIASVSNAPTLRVTHVTPVSHPEHSCLFVPGECPTLNPELQCTWMPSPSLDRKCTLETDGEGNMNNTEYMRRRLESTAVRCSNSECDRFRAQDYGGVDRAIASLRTGLPTGVKHTVVNVSFGTHTVRIGEGRHLTQHNNRTTDVYIPETPNGKVLVYMQFKSSDGFMEDWGFNQTSTRRPAGIFDASTFSQFATIPAEKNPGWMTQYGFWELNAALIRLLEENYTLITTSEFATYDNIVAHDAGDTYFFRDCVEGLKCGCSSTAQNKWWNNGSNPDVEYMTWLFESIDNGTLGTPRHSIRNTSIMGYSVGALAVSRYIEENAKGTPGFPQFAYVVLLSAGTYRCYQFDPYTCPWGTEAAYDHNRVRSSSHPPTLLLGTSNDFDADWRWFDKYFNTSRHFQSASVVVETNAYMHGMDVVYIDPLVVFLREYGSGGSLDAAPPSPGDAAECDANCCFEIDGVDFDASCARNNSARAPHGLTVCNLLDNVRWCGPPCVTVCESVAETVNSDIYDDDAQNGVSIHVLDDLRNGYSIDGAGATCPQAEDNVALPPWCPGTYDIRRGAVSFSYLDIELLKHTTPDVDNVWIFSERKTRGFLIKHVSAEKPIVPVCTGCAEPPVHPGGPVRRSWAPTCFFLANADTDMRTDCGCGGSQQHTECKYNTNSTDTTVVQTAPSCDADWNLNSGGIPFGFKNRWAYNAVVSCSFSE